MLYCAPLWRDDSVRNSASRHSTGQCAGCHRLGSPRQPVAILPIGPSAGGLYPPQKISVSIDFQPTKRRCSVFLWPYFQASYTIGPAESPLQHRPTVDRKSAEPTKGSAEGASNPAVRSLPSSLPILRFAMKPTSPDKYVRDDTARPKQETRERTKRLVAFQIGHALVWAAAIVGMSWAYETTTGAAGLSNAAVPWLACAYVVVNGLLTAKLFSKSQDP